jgi:hypothetical protein
MPDPDPGHFGPDFNSGSGLESAFADPSPCAALTHSRLRTLFCGFFFLTFYRLFRTFRTQFYYLEDMPHGVCVKRGGSAFNQIWVKEKNCRCFGLITFLKLRSSFYTRRGGDWRPQSAVWLVWVSM